MAWEEPPPKQMLLKMADIQIQLEQKWLQLYWPDDSRWWPAQVIQVNAKRNRAQLLYETGQSLCPPVSSPVICTIDHCILSLLLYYNLFVACSNRQHVTEQL